MCIKHIDGKGYNRDTDLAEIEFLMFFRLPYPRSEIFSDERGVRIGHPISVNGSFQKYQ